MDTTIKTRVDTELKQEFVKALEILGITISDCFRQKMEETVKQAKELKKEQITSK